MTSLPITIDCKGATVEEIESKLNDVANGETIEFSNGVTVTCVDNKTISAQQMITNLRSLGCSQTRISKHIQCPQANVSRWQAGLCKPNGEYMMRLVALWKEKCGG